MINRVASKTPERPRVEKNSRSVTPLASNQRSSKKRNQNVSQSDARLNKLITDYRAENARCTKKINELKMRLSDNHTAASKGHAQRKEQFTPSYSKVMTPKSQSNVRIQPSRKVVIDGVDEEIEDNFDEIYNNQVQAKSFRVT